MPVRPCEVSVINSPDFAADTGQTSIANMPLLLLPM